MFEQFSIFLLIFCYFPGEAEIRVFPFFRISGRTPEIPVLAGGRVARHGRETQEPHTIMTGFDADTSEKFCNFSFFSRCSVRFVVAHDCGYPLSRYTCRATRVAADFLDFRAFCRCSTGVALQPLKILVSHLPPRVPGGVAPKFGSEKVSRYTGVSQLQLRASRYTVQLRSASSQNCIQNLELHIQTLL